ncbi:MAG: hypothetical protein AAGG81_01905 [Chlamydiota bacterium]
MDIEVENIQGEDTIDMSQVINNQTASDADLTDIDRGIRLLSETIFTHGNPEQNYKTIVNDILLENKRNKTLIDNYEASEKRWNKWKWVSGCLTVATLAIVLFGDLFDQSLNTSEETELTVGKVLISVGSVFTVVTALFSAFSYWKQGREHEHQEQQLCLQQADNEMVKKLRIVLENWGALERAQENHFAEVDINKKANQCFKHIKDLPKDKQLPPKSCMASMTLQLLSDDHPTKQTANTIKKLEEELLPRSDHDEENKGFVDLGQKGTIDSTAPSNRSELEVIRQWKNLQQQMRGLYIDELYCGESRITRRNFQ